MRRPASLRALPLVLAGTLGCIDLDTTPDADCRDREAWYPDEDGDGLGEPTQVYVGCEPPAGWVQALAPVDSGTPST